MIYVTGDTHGEQNRFWYLIQDGEDKWNEKDYLIVTGDFGYLFLNNHIENVFLNVLEQKPYTICFCDGNHENFPAIYSYPKEKWNGGYVHKIRKNVIHLMRGQIYEIDGKKIFTMGGGYSRDKYMRREGFSWWKEEMPSNSEYREASSNLKEAGNKVDYIISHTAPQSAIFKMNAYPDPHEAELTGFLEWVSREVSFKKWYFGHWHTDKEIDEKFRAVWYDVIKLE